MADTGLSAQLDLQPQMCQFLTCDGIKLGVQGFEPINTPVMINVNTLCDQFIYVFKVPLYDLIYD